MALNIQDYVFIDIYDSFLQINPMSHLNACDCECKFVLINCTLCANIIKQSNDFTAF